MSFAPATRQRFMNKVSLNPLTGCWEWVGALTPAGYGSFYFNRAAGYAHRYVYALLVGAIGDGLEIDHLCRNRTCVNPVHLEPVTHAENMRRSTAGAVNGARSKAKTHCPSGHPYDSGNTHIDRRTGARSCLCCGKLSQRRHRAKAAS